MAFDLLSRVIPRARNPQLLFLATTVAFLITAFGLFRLRRWSVGTAIAWSIAITYVPGVAIMAFGGEGAILSSAIAESAASAIIGAGVIWTAIVMTRGDTERPAST